jgi:hypothetical protein
MIQLKSLLRLSVVSSLFAFTLGGTAYASVTWSATSLSSFKSLEEQDNEGNYHSDNGSNATEPVNNEFKFHKVPDDRRCEAKGANGVTINQNQTYYIGWRFKLSNTVNNNSIFQWKAYGSPMTQNYPFVLKMINGKITLELYTGGGAKTVLFSQTVAANTWYTNVIMIKTSSNAANGRVSYWFNGSQKVNNFACKTFDGSTIDPKWGIYGASGYTVDSYVKDLKIGTTYGDVDF